MRCLGLASVFLLALACCTGCADVYSIKPVGEKPLAITASEWEGTWIHAELSVGIKVREAEKGILELAWIDHEQGKLEMQSYEVRLRQSGRWTFANMRDNRNPEEKRYCWGRIVRDGRQIVFWWPDLEPIKLLMEQEKLPGWINGREVTLDALEPEQLKLITSGQEGVLFKWDEPLVLFHLSE